MNIQDRIIELNERIRTAEFYGMQDNVVYLVKQLERLIQERDNEIK